MRSIPAAPANRLLAELRPHDFELLASRLRPFALKQGAMLQEQGMPIEAVYFPVSGLLSLVTVMASGDMLEMAMIGREGAIGLSTGHGNWRAFARAMVQLPGVAMVMPAAQFQEAALRSEPIKDLVLRYKEMLLGQVTQTAACNALHSLEARLARRLLETNDHVNGARLTLTHDLISQMLGTRRTSVTLVAGKLQEQGLIQYRRGNITILDRTGLESTACECYGIMRRQTEALFDRSDAQHASLAQA
jgi:CRP-like cAMP-binding protein